MKLLIPIIVLVVLLVPVLVFSQPKDCRTDSDCPSNQFCNQTVFQCQPRSTVQPSPGSYIVVPPAETPTTTQQTTPLVAPTEQGCADSDGENIFTKGIVTSGSNSFEDFCISQNTVNEYICDNKKPTNKTIDCPQKYKCQEGRCVEVIGDVSFHVDEQIFGPRGPEGSGTEFGRALNKDLNYESYFVDKTVTNYDPLICEFTTNENIDKTKISFEVSDELEKVLSFTSDKLECTEKSCKAKVEPMEFRRGIRLNSKDHPLNKLTCKVIYNGNEVVSEPLNIANHVYYFIHLPPYINNYKEMYNQFLLRSQLDHTLAKPIYRNPGDCDTTFINDLNLFSKLKSEKKDIKDKFDQKLREKLAEAETTLSKLEAGSEEERKQIDIIDNIKNKLNGVITEDFLEEYKQFLLQETEISNETVNNIFFRAANIAIDRCLKVYGEYSYDYSDRKILLTKNPILNPYTQISAVGLSSFVYHGQVYIFHDDPLILSHEIGHTYDLCDEYDRNLYENQNTERLKNGEGCKNTYPTCCEDSLDNPDFKWGEDKKLKCVESGGRCSLPGPGGNGVSICGEGNISMAHDSNCQTNYVCCASKQRYIETGNNCYPPQITVLPSRACAGWPLNPDGSLTIINNKPDISSKYRSSMGPNIAPRFTEVFLVENQFYPQGVSYPLKPGIPKAG